MPKSSGKAEEEEKKKKKEGEMREGEAVERRG